MYRVTIIYILILLGIVAFLFVTTHNVKVVYIFWGIPIPFALFSKDLIKSYSKKYKETVIKKLFLSFFENYTIDAERKSYFIKLKQTGLISINKKIVVNTEDFITVTHKGNNIYLEEILLKQSNNIIFKGLHCSMDLKNCINQAFIINNPNDISIYKKFATDGLKTLDVNNVNILYQGTFDQEVSRPYIDFANFNHLSLCIQNGKLHCLFPSDRIIMDGIMDKFEPFLTTKYNSNNTYKFIRDEYYRINKIAKLLLKLQELNIT